MMKRKSIASVLEWQGNVIQILMLALIFSLGVSLLSSGLIKQFNLKGYQALSFGMVLIFLGLVFIFYKVKDVRNQSHAFNGVICVKDGELEGCSIPSYKAEERIKKYVASLCNENKAFAKLLRDSPLGLIRKNSGDKDIFHPSSSNFIVEQAIEYFAIERLSLTLSSHFNDHQFSQNELQSFNRTDVPNILLGNIYLEMFSKSMSERESFMDSASGQLSLNRNNEVIYCHGKNKSIYNRFELVLPRKSKVERCDSNNLVVKTPRFEMKIKSVFSGVNTVLPYRFPELYMNKNRLSIDAYEIELEIDIKFKMFAMFTRKGWIYYDWLDSYLSQIEDEFSFEVFKKDIGWVHNSALMSMIEKRVQTKN